MGAEDGHRDNRWRDGMGGAPARVRIVAGTGLVVLAGGLAGLAALRTARDDWSPPWLDAVLVTVIALVALGAMITAYRIVSRGLERRPADTAAPGQARAPSADLAHLQVDTHAGRRIIAVHTIEWMEANGNYARIHTAGEAFLYRTPLTRLESELDRRFIRVHRSALVNLKAVRRVEPLPTGDAELALASGARVRMSRRYAAAFHERTGRGRLREP